MGVYVADQTVVFLGACGLGAALGLLFDVFRISRVAFFAPKPLLFAEDLLFFVIAAAATFLFQLQATDGMLRWFLFIGEILGGVLYFSAASPLIMGLSKKIIEAVKAVCRFVHRWILRPIWIFTYQISVLIMQPFLFLGRISKKVLQNAKFRLKVYRKVLYNQCGGIRMPKRTCKGAERKCKKAKREKA